MKLQTVIETPEFIDKAKSYMNNETRSEFIDYIAANPLAGDLITGAGGARKIRWQSDANKGKRGGARIIYYYHDENIPIYLFTVYKKNQKENITDKEKKLLYRIIKLIVKIYNEGHYE